MTETVTAIRTEDDTIINTNILTLTETLWFTVGETITATGDSVTVTVTANALKKARRDSVVEASSVPHYASAVCRSWGKYTSACQCLGVGPTTITIDALTETVTEDITNIVTNDVLSTVFVTETEFVSVIATTSEAEMEAATVTIAPTQTLTVTPPVCVPSGQPCDLSDPGACCTQCCLRVGADQSVCCS